MYTPIYLSSKMYCAWRVCFVQEALNSSKKLYDVIFVEILMGHECVLPIAEKLSIPVVGTVTLHNWMIADTISGVPNNPMTIPSATLATSRPEMSFVERVQSLGIYFIVHYFYKSAIRPVVDKFYREYFDEDLLYKKDVSLVFYNNHASILPRSIPPNVIEIGGLHVKKANPLPQVR